MKLYYEPATNVVDVDGDSINACKAAVEDLNAICDVQEYYGEWSFRHAEELVKEFSR